MICSNVLKCQKCWLNAIKMFSLEGRRYTGGILHS